MITQSGRIAAAAKVIEALIKARKAVRLYPHGNPVTENSIDSLHEEIVKLLSIQDRLVFEVRQDAILFELEELFKPASPENDLPGLLFRDGIREVTFKKGLTRAETDKFVSVIATDFARESAAQDVVTRLWEQDFSHIRLIIHEPDLFEAEGPAFRPALSRKDLQTELKKAYEDAVISGEDKCIAPDVIDFSDEDLLALRNDVENNSADRTGKLLAIALELFLLENTEEYQSLEAVMKRSVEYALSKGKLDVLADFFMRVKAAYMDSHSDAAFRRNLLQVFSYFSSERFLSGLGSMLDSGLRLDEETFSKISKLLDGRSITGLIKLLGYLDSISARKTVVNLLVSIGETDVPAITAALYDNRWYVVRNIVIVLRRIGDRQARKHLHKIIDHKDARVRREVIKALAEMSGDEAAEALGMAFNDADRSVRQFALSSLSFISAGQAKALLMEKVRQPGFKELGNDEKREYYTALLRYDGEDVVHLLGKMLMRQPMFGRASNDENRMAIVSSIGQARHRGFMPYLVMLSDARSENLRRLAMEAIRKIEYER